MQITVSLAGNFGSGLIHMDQSLELPNNATIKLMLKALQKEFHSKFFTIGNLKANRMLILVNGEKIEPKKAKNYPIQSSDKISILQPIQGG